MLIQAVASWSSDVLGQFTEARQGLTILRNDSRLGWKRGEASELRRL